MYMFTKCMVYRLNFLLPGIIDEVGPDDPSMLKYREFLVNISSPRFNRRSPYISWVPPGRKMANGHMSPPGVR